MSAAIAAVLPLFARLAFAGFSASSSSNIAIYWGQNSANVKTGSSGSQQRLSYYCSNSNIDIIPISFLNELKTLGMNFANAGDNCTAVSGSTVLSCPEIEEDIKACQEQGKTIMLSIGGATYSEGGFASESEATAAADAVWTMFGPSSGSSGGSGSTTTAPNSTTTTGPVSERDSTQRPFGSAVIDGFDLDFESAVTNMVPFANALRAKMDAATSAGGKAYYLSAAPQCVFPDAAGNEMLDGAVAFDFIMVQFYNNFCGVQNFASGSDTQSSFNLNTWDNWAKTASKNKDVKVLIGVPGSTSAAGSGYVETSGLEPIFSYAEQYSSFGGMMAWDMSQVYNNDGFLDGVAGSLGRSGSSQPGTGTTPAVSSGPAKSSPASSTPTISRPATSTSTTSGPGTPTVSVPDATNLVGTATSSASAPLLPTSTFTTVTRSSDQSQPTSTPGGCDSAAARRAEILARSGVVLGVDSSKRDASTAGRWDQCGGLNWGGTTQCEEPYTCVVCSEWWSHCQ